MPWRPLSQRFASLPLVLAGPILRRTTSESVSVWLALLESRSVTLHVFNDSLEVLRSQQPVIPIEIGPQLHIVCVTADEKVTGQSLVSDTVYNYDVEFGGGTMLSDVVGEFITYPGNTKPTFVLPASDPQQLVLCQASCRKPHGAGLDALRALDIMLLQNATDPDAHPRPQLLMLTGDQIYADDVADALLAMLMDAAEELFGDAEELPGWGEIAELGPGSRAAIADRDTEQDGRHGFFTAAMPSKPEYAKSHLLGLAEYVLMYVFAWSNVLWDGDGTTPALPIQLPGNDQYSELEPWLDYMELVGAPHTEQIAAEVRNLVNFYSELPSVRRALANITTYMMFDDHEITDDWYLNAEWCATALASDAGRHVLSNGLAAFALCQAWGNTPGLFNMSASTGKGLFDALRSGEHRNDHTILENFLLPPKGGILNEQNGMYRLTVPPQPILWNYRVTYPAFDLAVMDTRTKREFPDLADGFAHLINVDALQEQTGTFLRDLVVLVFPPPLIGFPGIESVQSKAVGAERLDLDCEAPGLQAEFFEGVLATIMNASPDDGSGRKARILIFSGDVHYGYSARIRYSSIEVPGDLVLVQMTASAAKNAVRGTHLVDSLKAVALRRAGGPEFAAGSVPLPWQGLPETRWFSGFIDTRFLSEADRSKLVQAVRTHLTLRVISKSVEDMWRQLGEHGRVFDVTSLSAAERAQLPSLWRYRIQFLEDGRDPSDRANVRIRGREVVPDNNFGVVTLEGDNVRFDLWWYPDEDDNPTPATSVITSMDFDPV